MRFENTRSPRRRDVLTAGSVAALAGCGVARQWEFFEKEEARTISALVDQIIPADEHPSASEAGVVDFLDRQLTRAWRRHRGIYRKGLAEVNEHSLREHKKRFVELSSTEQAEGAKALEGTEFFETLIRHSLWGYFGSPRHGGNRNAVSWQMLRLPENQVRGRELYSIAETRG
jgi:gluconate 2-dehydrogenase gamma chain